MLGRLQGVRCVHIPSKLRPQRWQSTGQLQVVTRHPHDVIDFTNLKGPLKKRVHSILFVPSFCFNASAFEAHYLDYFALKGYTTSALNFHSEEKFTMDMCVGVLAEAMRSMGPYTVLAGHGSGALVCLKYLESKAAAGAILMSPLPPSRTVNESTFEMPQHLEELASSSDPLPLVLGRHHGLSHGDLEEASRCVEGSCVEHVRRLVSTPCLVEPFHPVRQHTLVIRGAQDSVVSEEDLRATAEFCFGDIDQPESVVTVPGAGHAMMLDSHWRGAAESIAEWMALRRL